MGFLIQYVATYAPWIYAICGLVALYQIYKIWLVRAERRQAVFSLEREKATRDTYNIFAVAMILLISMGITYFVSTVLADAVEPLVSEALAPSPEIPFLPTPTNTPLPVTPTNTLVPTETSPPTEETPEPEEVVEVVPTPEPVESTPTPTAAPAVQAPSCPDPRSVLLRPGDNETVRGVINAIGTATHENFQYYKIEYAAGANASGGFSYLTGGQSPVSNNFLGSVDTTSLSNGTWTLRLVVVDMTGNFPPPCQVTINVQN
jgi:hypothetical protein